MTQETLRTRTGRPIRWRIHIQRPPADVFASLDSSSARARFWAESATEHEGIIHFAFINGTRHDARLLRREPSRLWSIEYFGSPATFELEDDQQDGTDLTLTHEHVAAHEWAEVNAGWLNVLLPMKAWVQYGIDLRNHDPRRTWDQGYADQ